MPRPKKIKEEIKTRKQKEPAREELQKEPAPFKELQEYAVKCEKYPLENLQKLEKKLRNCIPTENPTVITYGFTGDKTSLYMAFLNHIKVVADISSVKMFCLESVRTYLEIAQKMLEVLKEWRGE